MKKQWGSRTAHWSLCTGSWLLVLAVSCLGHRSPVIQCLFVPHLEMRSWPPLAAFTSSKPCYCSGCIPEALLTYSSRYSAQNIPDYLPLCHHSLGTSCRECQSAAFLLFHTTHCCSDGLFNNKELNTDATGGTTLSLKRIYLLAGVLSIPRFRYIRCLMWLLLSCFVCYRHCYKKGRISSLCRFLNCQE
jgi:hypothetical protein